MLARTVRTALLLITAFFLAAGPLFADEGWGVGKVLARFRTRTGVVQLAVACMALGLFILMRKFAEPTSPRRED
jgi:hypothetical protein